LTRNFKDICVNPQGAFSPLDVTLQYYFINYLQMASSDRNSAQVNQIVKCWIS